MFIQSECPNHTPRNIISYYSTNSEFSLYKEEVKKSPETCCLPLDLKPVELEDLELKESENNSSEQRLGESFQHFLVDNRNSKLMSVFLEVVKQNSGRIVEQSVQYHLIDLVFHYSYSYEGPCGFA